MEYQQSSWSVGVDGKKIVWASIDENKVKLSTHSGGGGTEGGRTPSAGTYLKHGKYK